MKKKTHSYSKLINYVLNRCKQNKKKHIKYIKHSLTKLLN